MATTVLPPREVLPDVLPTARLSASGRPVPEIRAALRRIPDARNALTVASCYVQSFGVIAAAVVVDRWWAWLLAFLLMGRAHALFAILGHEAAHRLLFRVRWVNDGVGRWLLAAAGLVPFEAYKRGHLAHHRDELGPDEPDTLLYAGYPVDRASLRRKLVRDAVFVSGLKNLRLLWRATRRPSSRGQALRIVAVQVVIWAALAVAGHPWLYPLLWLAPWMTVWRVLNRLRAIAEHGGMQRSPDRRLTTHVVRQHAVARFWMVPYNTGWHLAHHVDMGIPFRNLPALHAELVRAGWLVPGIEYRSYLALWNALSSRQLESTAAMRA